MVSTLFCGLKLQKLVSGTPQKGYQNVPIFYVLINGGREGVQANKDNVLICALFFGRLPLVLSWGENQQLSCRIPLPSYLNELSEQFHRHHWHRHQPTFSKKLWAWWLLPYQPLLCFHQHEWTPLPSSSTWNLRFPRRMTDPWAVGTSSLNGISNINTIIMKQHITAEKLHLFFKRFFICRLHICKPQPLSFRFQQFHILSEKVWLWFLNFFGKNG